VQAVVLPRTPAQRDALREAALPSLVLPERAVDAQSLIALADLVVSAGGTMNREAVALGTPVWTTFAGTMGAVDEGLIAGGRLAELTDADALLVATKTTGSEVVRRDPELMLDLLLSALDG
jgi:predicted glycosyltransferase